MIVRKCTRCGEYFKDDAWIIVKVKEIKMELS